MRIKDEGAEVLFRAPFPTIVCDTGGRILYVNQAAVEISGRKESDLIGELVSKIYFAKEELADFDSAFSVVQAQQKEDVLISFPFAMFGHFGRPAVVKFMCSSFAADARVILYVDELPANDVENSLLKKAMELAQQDSRAKTDFLAMMSHEIRTPLTGVIGILEILKISINDEKLLKLVATARDSADSLLQILSDVLDLTKFNATGIKFKGADFQIRQLIDSVVQALEPQGIKQGNALLAHVDQEVPEFLFGDSGRLRQVIMNLLANAIKFTENGKVEINVRLIRRRRGKVVIRCEISDTGIGIPRDKQTDLFKDFSALHPTISRKFSGIGLGLSICKRIVEAAGGVIAVTSQEGAGSMFWFTMPYKESSGIPADPAFADDKSWMDKPQITGRVLIVDDNEINRMVMRKFLEHAGFQVDDVESAAFAMDCLGRADAGYGCVLMDMAMPDKDGIEATQAIRNSGWSCSDIPVIGITAFSQASQHEAMLRSGMDEVVTKPINQQQLVRLVSSHMGRAGISFDAAVDSKGVSSLPQPKGRVVLEEKILRDLESITGRKGVKAIVNTWQILLDSAVGRTSGFSAGSSEMVKLSRLAHNLAGSSGQLGAFQIQARALALEAACNRLEAASVQSHLLQLALEAADVKQEIQRLFAQGE